jgi:hypothetical protein
VAHICAEAEGLMQEGRWSDLVSLLLTSFDLIFANALEKGVFSIPFSGNALRLIY